MASLHSLRQEACFLYQSLAGRNPPAEAQRRRENKIGWLGCSYFLMPGQRIE